MGKFIAGLVVFLGIIALAFGISLLMVFPVMWLINYLFTPAVLMFLFGIAKITFWKAFWLTFLTSILFKGSSTSSSK